MSVTIFATSETTQTWHTSSSACAPTCSNTPTSGRTTPLERYLAGLSALIRDVDGLLSNRGEQPPDRPSWALIAELLVGGSGYE